MFTILTSEFPLLVTVPTICNIPFASTKFTVGKMTLVVPRLSMNSFSGMFVTVCWTGTLLIILSIVTCLFVTSLCIILITGFFTMISLHYICLSPWCIWWTWVWNTMILLGDILVDSLCGGNQDSACAGEAWWASTMTFPERTPWLWTAFPFGTQWFPTRWFLVDILLVDDMNNHTFTID